ncbi:hypothetical protein DFJ74DRAFT_427247 [Hyaloraphidium curvatum]|nr:hypothetical protein DFJ74DRAFT_427247 [Hyaloraphidium curvatum]
MTKVSRGARDLARIERACGFRIRTLSSAASIASTGSCRYARRSSSGRTRSACETGDVPKECEVENEPAAEEGPAAGARSEAEVLGRLIKSRPEVEGFGDAACAEPDGEPSAAGPAVPPGTGISAASTVAPWPTCPMSPSKLDPWNRNSSRPVLTSTTPGPVEPTTGCHAYRESSTAKYCAHSSRRAALPASSGSLSSSESASRFPSSSSSSGMGMRRPLMVKKMPPRRGWYPTPTVSPCRATQPPVRPRLYTRCLPWPNSSCRNTLSQESFEVMTYETEWKCRPGRRKGGCVAGVDSGPVRGLAYGHAALECARGGCRRGGSAAILPSAHYPRERVHSAPSYGGRRVASGPQVHCRALSPVAHAQTKAGVTAFRSGDHYAFEGGDSPIRSCSKHGHVVLADVQQ